MPRFVLVLMSSAVASVLLSASPSNGAAFVEEPQYRARTFSSSSSRWSITTSSHVNYNNPSRNHNRNVALSMSIPNPLDTLTSGLASICRLPRGVTVSAAGQVANPHKIRLKKLYDVENDPACRAVRERITKLDLVVERVIPAAPNSRVFTDPLYPFSLGEAASTTLPRLVVTENSDDILDENADQEEEQRLVISGQDAILDYLDQNFPDASRAATEEEDEEPSEWASLLQTATASLAGLLRMGRGTMVSPAAASTTAAASAKSSGKSRVPPRPPAEPLILYSYEGNQFCRLVREVMTELDLVYELRSAGKESPRRAELGALPGREGSSQCPYLVDTNTGVAMGESADIIRYLYKQYAAWTPPNELLQWASDTISPLLAPAWKALAPLQAQWAIAASSNNKNAAAKAEALAAAQQAAREEIEETVQSNPVVIYTYSLSPFCSEAKAVLDRLDISYTEVNLGAEFLPGLLSQPHTRAALLDMTGQSSLPHIFVGGQSIGGLFSGTPGLIPALEAGTFQDQVEQAMQNTPQPTTLEAATTTTQP